MKRSQPLVAQRPPVSRGWHDERRPPAAHWPGALRRLGSCGTGAASALKPSGDPQVSPGAVGVGPPHCPFRAAVRCSASTVGQLPSGRILPLLPGPGHTVPRASTPAQAHRPCLLRDGSWKAKPSAWPCTSVARGCMGRSAPRASCGVCGPRWAWSPAPTHWELGGPRSSCASFGRNRCAVGGGSAEGRQPAAARPVPSTRSLAAEPR